MRALALLPWSRAAKRREARDSARANPAADAIDDGVEIVGDPRREAAWARFAARPVAAPSATPVRDGSPAHAVRSETTVAVRAKES